MEELNKRLDASRHSCMEANEVVKSQKASISELEAKLDEERDHRKEERNMAAAKLEAAVKKLQSESQEETKRLSDAACLRETELQAEINNLQKDIEMRHCVETLYSGQLTGLQQKLDIKVKELTNVNRISSEQKHAMEELNKRLNASRQSCTEANEVMKSQKASISELEAKLDEERDHRKEERNMAAAKLEAAVQKLQSESQEEIKRLSDAACLRETELQTEINNIQAREKMWCSQVESLRTKLEEARQKLVISDDRLCQLEAQVVKEQLTCTNGTKVVQEEAWAKVSAPELEVNAAMRDLELEKRRLEGARERILLRETELRAFYSTTKEIAALFSKQQEQLKALQRPLEDEGNHENTSLLIGLTEPNENIASHALLHLRNSNAYSGAKSCSAIVQRCSGNKTML